MTLMGSFQIGCIGHMQEKVEANFKQLMVDDNYSPTDLIAEFLNESLANLEDEGHTLDKLICAIAYNDKDSMSDFLKSLSAPLMKDANDYYKMTFNQIESNTEISEDEREYLQKKIRKAA